MAFDKTKFRERTEARARAQRAEKLKENEVPEQFKKNDAPISDEEQKVVEQYRKWKASRGNSTPMTEKEKRVASIKKRIAAKRENIEAIDGSQKDDASAFDPSYGGKVPAENHDPSVKQPKAGGNGGGNGAGANAAASEVKAVTGNGGKTLEKSERVAKLKRKLEKKARIEKIKARIAEKREAAGDTNSSKQIREEATKLKERIAKLRKQLREEEFAQPAAPAMAQPAAPAGDPASAMMDPMADPAAASTLPPEVVTEIQNIQTAAQSLASLAGIQPQTELGAEEGIPAEMGTDGMMDQDMGMEQPVLEGKKMNAAQKAQIMEKIAARKSAAKRPTVDSMVESTKDKVAKRREALKALRAKSLKESYDEIGDPATQVKSNIKDLTNDSLDDSKRIDTTGRTIGANSPSMPGKNTLKPAKTWPTKPSKSAKFESEEVDEGQEVLEETWDEQHISHYIERKELDFKDLIKQGMLG